MVFVIKHQFKHLIYIIFENYTIRIGKQYLGNSHLLQVLEFLSQI